MHIPFVVYDGYFKEQGRMSNLIIDYYAIELMRFLQEKGVKIPEEMSIAGFDDCPLCELVYPTLTTIRQNGQQWASVK